MINAVFFILAVVLGLMFLSTEIGAAIFKAVLILIALSAILAVFKIVGMS